jgi:hypothetical protein
MKKVFHILMAGLASLTMVSCQDFLSANSPSTVDSDFVFSDFTTAKTVMLGAFNTVTGSFTSGLPTNLDCIGSDTDRCSMAAILPMRLKSSTSTAHSRDTGTPTTARWPRPIR